MPFELDSAKESPWIRLYLKSKRLHTSLLASKNREKNLVKSHECARFERKAQQQNHMTSGSALFTCC